MYFAHAHTVLISCINLKIQNFICIQQLRQAGSFMVSCFHTQQGREIRRPLSATRDRQTFYSTHTPTVSVARNTLEDTLDWFDYCTSLALVQSLASYQWGNDYLAKYLTIWHAWCVCVLRLLTNLKRAVDQMNHWLSHANGNFFGVKSTKFDLLYLYSLLYLYL